MGYIPGIKIDGETYDFLPEAKKFEIASTAADYRCRNYDEWAVPMVEGEYYRSDNGEIAYSDTFNRSDCLIAVIPGETYYAITKMYVMFFDRDKTFRSHDIISAGKTFTIPEDRYYIGLDIKLEDSTEIRIRRQFELHTAQITLSSDEYTSLDVIEGEYYYTTGGIIKSLDGWVRSKYLIPAKPHCIYDADMDGVYYVDCYDYEMKFLSAIKIGKSIGQSTPNFCTPLKTAYVGFCTSDSDSLAVRELNGTENSYEYPFEGAYYLPNMVMYENGVTKAADNYGVVCIPNINEGDRIYTNIRTTTNCICKDESDNVLSYGETGFEDVAARGRIFTIPEGTRSVFFNFDNRQKHRDTYSVRYARMSKGKSVLCIGDSITWLDGRSHHDPNEDTTKVTDPVTKNFLGWQQQLLAAGYQVQSAGFSGYTYAVIDGVGSIYTQIVTNGYDVSGYDYIILFGGTNDDGNGVPVGTIPTAYSDREYNTGEMAGALSAIIDYIRTNNPACKIILSSPIKSQTSTRPYAEAKTYRDTIRDCAEFWSCCFVDNFSLLNVSPSYDNFDEYFYDNTHPNRAGMERIGKQMLRAVEEA